MMPGIYNAVVKQHCWITSRAGHPGLEVTVEVSDDWDSKPMTGTIWFTDKALGMARMQLRALGFDPDTQKVGDIGPRISLVGHQCEVELAEEDYNGRTSLKIKRFGGRPKPPTDDQLRNLDVLLARAKTRQPAADSEPAAQKPPAPLHPKKLAKMQEEKNAALDAGASVQDDIPF